MCRDIYAAIQPQISRQEPFAAFLVSLYQEPLRTCIHGLKYDGNKRLAVPLGLLLAQAYKRYALHADMLIPVPLHSKRQQPSNCLTTRIMCDKL
jgi:predicted amidophosphoribosyltransferase